MMSSIAFDVTATSNRINMRLSRKSYNNKLINSTLSEEARCWFCLRICKANAARFSRGTSNFRVLHHDYLTIL